MHKFNEELLQFIWRNKLLKPLPLITVSGKEVFILHPGEWNANAGPDFFNAKIRLENIVLAGNIELHFRSSDWLRHGHQSNKSYDRLVLHVVYEHDLSLDQNVNNQVEVLELKELIDESTIRTYQELLINKNELPCAPQLRNVQEIKFMSWMERMTIERLEEKVKRLEYWFAGYQGDYCQTFFTALLRSFGFGVNSEPFELLARQMPAQLLLKHADDLLCLQALLLGMAGFLNEYHEDPVRQKLQSEFAFLSKKYGLQPLAKELFKFSKMRPANFPDLRLIQLAGLIHSNPGMFVNPHHLHSYKEWKSALATKGKEFNNCLGSDSIEKIIINAVVPFLFFFSKKIHKEEYADTALTLLSACKMESNHTTRLFASRKNEVRSAATSQAMIHLYDRFCQGKRCLNCGIAANLLKSG